MLFALGSDRPTRRAEFEALVMPLVPRLTAGARRLTRQPQDAADLVQETFLRAYRTFDNFVTGTNAKAWLFTIMYSVFSNTYRARQREIGTVSIDEWETRFERTIELPDPSAHLAVLQAAGLDAREEAVNEALQSLPEPFRIAIWLVDVEELSYEQAAEVAGCPVGTLRSRLFRGRRAMAALLGDVARRRRLLPQEPTHG